MIRVGCLAAAIARFGAVGSSLTAVSAQNYPDKTIKFIVPYTPGSPVDADGCVIAEDLEKPTAGIKA